MTGGGHLIDRASFDAVIFDMDGVVTDTATTHATAWKQLFDSFLRARSESEGGPFHEFTQLDYEAHVDGKPRYDGVRDFLASRGVTIPEGDFGDAPGFGSVRALGNAKDEYFLKALDAGVRCIPNTIEFVRTLQSAGFGTAVISASRNAELVLERAGLAALFPVRVDGVISEGLAHAGKPAPDIFVEAASRLGVTPARAVVVEDAQAGVEAGRRGGFGLVVGLANADQEQALREHGAHVVVSDLGDFAVRSLPVDAKSRPIASLPSALASWEGIASRIRAGRPAVFLDYDGTLTPIVERPEDAHLSAEMRAQLARVSAVCPVVIVSGRDVSFVVSEVGLDSVHYLGSHGFQVVAPADSTLSLDDRSDEFARFLPSLDAAEAALGAAVQAIPGARIERKRFSLAVHYRQAADGDVPAVEKLVDDELSRRPDLRKTGGKKVFELRPDIDWDKGRAVRWVMDALGFEASAVPVFVGDDLTDEDAFTEISADGVTVVVGSGFRLSAAHHAVADPDEVAVLLGMLADAVAEGSEGGRP